MNVFYQLLSGAGHWRPIQTIKKSYLFLVLMLSTAQLFAQTTVTGTVKDDRGQTLPGVSVSVKGTSAGAVTDVQGRYSLKVNAKDAVLVFSFIGYAAIEENLNGRSTVNVTLKETQQNLNEVVVIGYGTTRRRDLTGSVASVSGKEIANVPVPNIAQAMQGKLPGVNITTQDGRPGGNVNIRVRGGTSISQSNQALVLIDGIPGNLNDIPADQVESVDVLKDASSAAIYGSRGANGVVLVTTKSAKAGKTVVSYNGYARINTPLKYLEPLNPYEYLKFVWANAASNAAAYQTPFEQLFGLGANAGSNTGGIESYRNLATEDLQRQAYKQTTSWNHALTISGGTEKTKVLFNATYSDDQGMKLNSYQKRATAQFKLNQKITDNLQFDLNVRYANTPTLGDEGTTSGGGSILSSSYQFRPISTANILGNKGVLTGSNNITQYGRNTLSDNYSPVARIGDAFPLSLSQNFVGIASVNWVIIKGLTYHTDFSGNGLWTQRKFWNGAVSRGYLDDITGVKRYAGDADYRKNDSWSMRWANTLGYEFNVGKESKFNVLAGHEFFDSGGTGISIQSNNFPSNFDRETAFAQINQYDRTLNSFAFSSNVNTPDRLNSYFGRLMYTFKDKYLLTATFRADASSRFTEQNRWGYFPGAAFAWRASEESFLKDVNWLNNLKLRVAYGAVGNNNIPNGSTVQSWGSVTDPRNQYYINHSALAAYQLSTPSILANPNLKWETTITRDIGTDFSLFGDKLSGTIDLYWNTTKDLLLQTTTPPVTGFTTTYANVGQVSNKGIEFSLLGTIVSNKNWRVTAGGNINFNRNKVDALASNVTGLYGSAWNGTSTYPASDYQLIVGRPVGLVRGLVYEGFYTPDDFNYNNGLYTLKSGVADLSTVVGGVTHGIVTGTDRPTGQVAYPGLPKYKDINSDGKIDDKDLGVIANTTPRFTGGFTFNVTYKNIDMGMNFNYSVGNDIYNANKLLSLFGPKEAGVYQNKLAFMANSYKMYDVANGQLVRLRTPDQFNAANANASYPLSVSETGVTSTLGIEKGSFLRLNTLTLGYTIPKSVLSKVHVSNLRIYGSVYNLLTITKYSGLDPEVGTNDNANNSFYPTSGLDYGAYPRARSFVVGLNLNF